MAKNVDHIIAGKAISRAIKVHFLVYVALRTTKITQIFPEYFLHNESDFEHELHASTIKTCVNYMKI